jgi:hypothetical protein|tara:strand:+ start:529 stop:1209 length:681 start_codon:yes stop_codon:yes gene_type:complete
MAVAGATGIITSDLIADNAVTNNKLGSDISITNAQLAGSIANAKLANSSLTINGTSIALGASDTITAGKILQVVQTVKTDTFSTSSPAETAFVDVTGFSVTITPSATSSKILILWNMMIGSGADNVTYMKLKRGTTDILLGDASSTRIRMSQGQGGSYNSHPWKMDCASGQYEDSPNTTSATTYKWVWASNGSTSSYLNRSGRDHTSLNDEDGRTVSTITAMEIAG